MARHGKHKKRKKKSHKLTSSKARTILKEGKARGHRLTKKQKRFFGAIAGGQRPRKRR